MLGEWPEYPLEELCELIVDCPHSTPKWTDQGVVVLRNQYIRNGRLDLSDPSYTTEEGYEARIKRAVPTAGDLVLTREAPMGEVCKIPEGLRCCLGQRMVLIRANSDLIDPDYLLFVIQSPYVQHQISWSEGTGTTVSNIRLPDLRGFKIPTPSLAIQRWIASVLKSLDDKTALNRQINTTLESMAQALFKSWFVDFDPVIDNALAAGNDIPDELQARAERRRELLARGATARTSTLPADIQSLFPNAFVLTEEMGWVPEGWGVGVIEDLLVLQRGFDLPKNARTDGEYPLMAASGQDGTHNEFKVSGPGITTGRSGKLGEVCFVETDFWPLNTTLWVKEFRRSSPYHAFYLLKSMDLEKYNSGSAVPTLNRNYVHNVSALLPSAGVIAAYDKFVSACYSKNYDNDEQCKSLANLRDSLLPKLLSGQLSIPDAEQTLDEVS
ncbi:restriction endonuclease subunit S [Pokkaliibacter sp. MBI-7]|uniref:restriction endonuclease subunit S n=1 Tax=Pokkaliibacter sp. MBI-7 TaxID=3040600 RepID=UPI00244691BF|nr:restriction endonuclease subunit S [Pokkaliibacter sp. MBI-7]MDH2433076.1 restriction endonuclease subunit S [Pokkaliibacter sp. MBI-7]